MDDSPFAARAAEVGVTLAKSLKAEVAFVHVFDPAVAPGHMWGIPMEKTVAMSEHQGKDLLATFRERSAMRPKVAEFLETGKPAFRIVEVAKNWSADLIVMGSHGRGKVQGLLLGSVSEGVLHHAPCPVLIIRAQA